jgi:hypothetical protein
MDKKDRYVVYEYNEKASPAYRGCRFITVWHEHIEEKPDSKTIIIAQDVSNEEAYRLVGERSNFNIDAFINTLPPEINNEENKKFLRNLMGYQS